MAVHEPRPLTLPQEICGIICKELRRRDLHNVCSVSNAFRHEAERILYVSPLVIGGRAIKSWCLAITRRPYLALGIRKLILLMPPQLEFEADDLARLFHGLHLCVNLVELHIHMHDPTSPSGTMTKIGDEVQAWILEEHPFELRRFKNSYFRPNTLVRFLRSQPSIETLMFKNSGPAQVCDVALPNLRNIECSSATLQEFSMPTWHPRTIWRLQYALDCASDVEELSTFVAVTQFADTLKSLSIIRNSCDSGRGLDLAVLAACVAAQVPDVKFLQILDRTVRSEAFHIPFLPFPIQLRKIETLIFHPPVQSSENSETTEVSAYIELRSKEGRTRTAERLMESLPTLKRFVLLGQDRYQAYEFIRNMDPGEALFERERHFDDTEWLQVP